MMVLLAFQASQPGWLTVLFDSQILPMITLLYTPPHCSFSRQIVKLESSASPGFPASILLIYSLPFQIPGLNFSSTSA